MLISNSGSEIWKASGDNGIAVKSTSGSIRKRAVPRKTPAPKDRRSEVNTTCKYKLERCIEVKWPLLQISDYKLLLQPEFWSAIFQDRGPFGHPGPQVLSTWRLVDAIWLWPKWHNRDGWKFFLVRLAKFPVHPQKQPILCNPFLYYVFFIFGHQMIMVDESWWSWCSYLVFVTYD